MTPVTTARPESRAMSSRLGTSAHTRARKVRMYERAARWATQDSPWDLTDFVRLARLLGVGGGGLAVCWYGMSGESNWHKQLVWIAGAVGCLVIAGFGALMWLLAGLREVHHGALEVITDIRADRLTDTAVAAQAHLNGFATSAHQPAGIVGGLVVGQGMTRAHREDCTLVQGKSVQPVSEGDLASLGLRLCGMCCE